MTLDAEVAGRGPAVVLLHGQPGSSADWRRVVPLLESRFTVIVPDRPGYGRTGGPAQGIGGNAAAVLSLLDELGVARATIVGHSWSGAVAIALAEQSPDRVVAAVLVASVGPAEPLGWLDRMLAIPPIGSTVVAVSFDVAARALSFPPVRQRLGRFLRGTSDGALAAIAQAGRGSDVARSFVVEQRALFDELAGLAPGLADISVPVIVIVGEADRIVRATTGERLAATIPGARLVRVEGAGHLLAVEHPGAVAKAVAEAATGASS